MGKRVESESIAEIITSNNVIIKTLLGRKIHKDNNGFKISLYRAY